MELFQIWDHQKLILPTSLIGQLQEQRQVQKRLMLGRLAKTQLLKMVN